MDCKTQKRRHLPIAAMQSSRRYATPRERERERWRVIGLFLHVEITVP